MWRAVSCVACIGAAGCVSSGTWSTFEAVERELDDRDAAARSARASPREPSDCSELATQVVAAFPTLRAGRARARAAIARGRSEGALPAPELMFEVWDFPIGDPQLADREGMYMVGVAQELPPAGALDGRARAAAAEAQEALAEASDGERELRMRGLEACIEWSTARQEATGMREAEALADRMRETLLAQIRGGGGSSIADVARLEVEIARTRRLRFEAEGRSEAAAARVNAWLGRGAQDRLTAPPPLDAPPPFDGAERWIARALEERGALRAARARARAADAMADAADAEASVPTFSLRATYMQMPSMRPGIGLAFGMTLPWLWSGEGAARDAARADADAAREEIAAMELDAGGEVSAAAAALEATARTLTELRQNERPAVQRTLEALEAGLATGSVDLTEWLDAARAARDLEIEEARLLGDAARAWAELEAAVGTPLAQETAR